ncbi:MAG: cation:dicarboxylate symporter family transporter [[Clostridium] innocuum]
MSGVGLGASFAFITPILAIDPIIDMMRTMLNVSGSLTNAIMVDRQLELMDMELYQDMTRKESEKV